MVLEIEEPYLSKELPVINFVRLNRISSDSWMTYELPYPMKFDRHLDRWFAHTMPGWEVVSGCKYNPDESFGGLYV